MKKAKIKNNTGRMLVVQIAAAHSAAGMQTKTDRVIRYDRHRDGAIRPMSRRVQYPPVLRLASNATSEPLPVDILRDPQMKELRRTGAITVEYVEATQAPTQPATPKKTKTRSSGKKQTGGKE